MPIRNTIRTLLRPRETGLPADESAIFFPTAAAQDITGTWQIPIHGWTFRPAELSRLRRAAFCVVRLLLRRRVPRDDPGLPLLRRRAGAFLADNSRWSRVHIVVGETVHAMKRSHADGHFTGKVTLSAREVDRVADATTGGAGRWLAFRAHVAAADPRHFEGRALLLPPEGLSAISDIDDTIKITEVLARRKMLRNTFLRDFASVPEMAAVYRRWQATRDAAFHYVSASPWHLYPFLQEFLTASGFPDGTFHLRDFRLMPGALRHSLRASARVKRLHIRSLIKTFPRRTFILIGDSGEADAATYSGLAREFPGNIQKILVRNVTGESRAAARWKRTFAQIDPTLWQLFTHPSELG